MIYFDRNESNSIKSIALKTNTNINTTSRFINGKMLFAKILFESFVYYMIDVFCFPTEEVKNELWQIGYYKVLYAPYSDRYR